MKHKTQNWRLELTGLAKPSITHRVTGMGPALARQEVAGQVFARVCIRTDPFLLSKPRSLAGYPDPLLTLVAIGCNHLAMRHWVPSDAKTI